MAIANRLKVKTMLSLLVPYRKDPDQPEREAHWAWLKQYWKYQLPYGSYEIIEADSDTEIFSKTQAVNKAAKLARGDIFVILDTDAMVSGFVLQYCAMLIRSAIGNNRKLWYIPYRSLFRLNEKTTNLLTSFNPEFVMYIPSPPDFDMIENSMGSMHGRRFGAMIQIMPREGFETVGGMDERFVGWGGEDVAFVLAMDTLYINHKTIENDVLHLWHPSNGSATVRMWAGQEEIGANDRLASRYNNATGDVDMMRALVDEW